MVRCHQVQKFHSAGAVAQAAELGEIAGKTDSQENWSGRSKAC